MKAALQLVNLCLSTTSFRFHDTHYVLTNGLSVGSPASPVVGNLFMEKFEREALESFISTKPKKHGMDM